MNFNHIATLNLKNWGLIILTLLLVLIITIFQDYLESSIQAYQFYFSESLLFKVFWVLFVPFGFILFKYLPSLIKKKQVIAIIAILILVIITHLLLNGLLVNLLSRLFYNHHYSVLGVIFNTISSHLSINVFVYLIILLAVVFNDLKEQTKVEGLGTFKRNILIEHGRKKTIITVQDIETIETEKPYVLIHAGGEKYLYNSTLKTLATELDPEQFIRIHKSSIVNFQKVKTMKSRLNGDYDLTLNSGKEIRMSRNYAVDFKAKFENKTSS